MTDLEEVSEIIREEPDSDSVFQVDLDGDHDINIDAHALNDMLSHVVLAEGVRDNVPTDMPLDDSLDGAVPSEGVMRFDSYLVGVVPRNVDEVDNTTMQDDGSRNDFDPLGEMPEREIEFGLELEFPKVGDGESMITRGQKTNVEYNEYPSVNSQVEWDRTVGIEMVSPVIQGVEDAVEWHVNAIADVEDHYGVEYQPCGQMPGSTAGLHIHISPISRQHAQKLNEWSQQAWLQLFTGSSVYEDDNGFSARVFRGGRYCQFEFNNDHYSCLNRRGPWHYEWRLPEPLLSSHLRHVLKFLELFKENPPEAKEYALNLIQENPEELTAIKRARKIEKLSPDNEVHRSPHPESEDFFHDVKERDDAPYIYRVVMNTGGGRQYYAFISNKNTTVEVDGGGVSHELGHGDVIRADTLMTPSDRSLAEDAFDLADLEHEGEETSYSDSAKLLKDATKKAR